MNYYKNLYILGTSHVSQKSVDDVEDFILNNKPDIVAIELDKKRFYALTHELKASFRNIFSLGVKSYLINVFGAYFEKKIGKIVGVSPGSEMKKAIELAKKNNIRLSLIDQDINITLKKLSKAITIGVIFKFIGEIIGSILFKKRIIGPFDIRKVPPQDVINDILKYVKEKYLKIYVVLIEERNEVMAKNLYKLINKYSDKKIFAIVGAGHEFEIINIIKRIET